MKVDLKTIQLALGVCLAALALPGFATEEMLLPSLAAGKFYTQDSKSFLLAINDTEAASTRTISAPAIPAEEFKPPLFTPSKTHQYLGIGTVVLAGLTALSHPEECEDSNCSANAPRDVNGTHATLAKATVAMAIATIATGLYAHRDDFSLEDGWSDPDNLHVLLAVTGAAVMAYAVNLSANSSTPVNHAALAEAGALSMVVAIKLTW